MRPKTCRWGGVLLLVAVSAACARVGRPPAGRPGSAAGVEFQLTFWNKSSGEAVPATITLDDAVVMDGAYAPWAYGAAPPSVSLSLAPGSHRLRAVVAGETASIEIHVRAGTECTCQVLYYDEPQQVGEGRPPSRVVVERIYPC